MYTCQVTSRLSSRMDCRGLMILAILASAMRHISLAWCPVWSEGLTPEITRKQIIAGRRLKRRVHVRSRKNAITNHTTCAIPKSCPLLENLANCGEMAGFGQSLIRSSDVSHTPLACASISGEPPYSSATCGTFAHITFVTVYRRLPTK